MNRYPQKTLFHHSLIVQNFFFNRTTLTLFLTSTVLLISTLLLFIASRPLAAQYSPISFGERNGVQFADPGGHNEITFWLNRDVADSATIDLALYKLSETAFITHYEATEPYQPFTPDLTGLTPETTWQELHEPSESPQYQKRLQIPSTDSGLYILTATVAESGDTAASLLVIGSHVLVLKQGNNGQVMAWASTLQDGSATNGMNVQIYDKTGAMLTEGVTDADGLVMLNVDTSEPSMAIGQYETTDGTAWTVAGFDFEWSATGSGWYASWGGASRQSYQVHLQTDRPIYRPGHTVNFAAIARQSQDGSYTPISASQAITIILRDSRYNEVEKQVLNADSYGTLNGHFVLGEEPPLGNYFLDLQIGDESFQQSFSVESYRKPEYQVEVNTATAFAIAGDSIPITVDANYFFGQPVNDAAVVFKVYRDSYYYPEPWWLPDIAATRDTESRESPPPPFSFDAEVATFEGRTDVNGQWTIDFTPEVASSYYERYRFEATVTDAREQPIQGESSLPIYWNALALSMRTEKYGYEINEPVILNIEAKDHAGSAVANQQIDLAVYSDYKETTQVLNLSVTTDEQGKVQATLPGLPQGWYRITATTTDDRGRGIRLNRYLWVYDQSSSSWWYTSNDELSIATDQESYAVGETAQLLIQSRITNTMALLTLEREDVREERVISINGPVTAIELPIDASYAPNIYAKVHLFKRTDADKTVNEYESQTEGDLLVSQAEIVVPAIDKKLDVTISADVEQYEPGQDAQLTLRVADASGQPQAARVTLALVDEAIFALQADQTADIFNTFHGVRPNQVGSYDTLLPPNYYYGDIAFAEPDDDAAAPLPAPTGTPSPGAESDAGSQDSTSSPRLNFLDTAYWNASIETDAGGLATLSVPLPDNLTTWRVIVRAVTIDTKVGEATSNLLVTKEIIASPALPRFAVLGDRFSLGVVGQNFSGQDTTGEAQLESSSLVLLDSEARTLNLPHAGSDVGRWTAVASALGSGSITATVDTSIGQDQVILSLETKPFAVPERQFSSGQVEVTATETFELPFNAVHEASQAELRLSPSIALGILDGLEDLIEYPYGCVEQTMSRLLPSAVAAKAYTDLGIPNPKAEELPKIINQGVQKLYGYQHSDGSWGWFYDDDGGVYLTSYVLLGLTSVQQAGFEVDQSVLTNGFAYLDSHFSFTEDTGTKAYALYVKSVAGRGDLTAAQGLVSQQGELDASALAALALTLHLEDDSSAAQMVLDRLITLVTESETSASWPIEENEWNRYRWTTMASAEKNTAMAVRALAAIQPDSPLLPKAVRWLMHHRRGAGWRNTQATAFAVLGLVDYVKVSGELQADYSYTVALNGESVSTGQVTPASVTEPIEPILISGDLLSSGENQLQIQRTDNSRIQGQLYYTFILDQQLFYDGFEEVSSADQGISVSRSYRLVEGEARDDGAYNVGDVVEVSLTLSANEELWYLLLEDPLPAGFEALNERLNTVTYNTSYLPFYWYEWGYNRKDIRDDRVDFFITHLGQGERNITYLMRATTAGEFSALPAQVYPMYEDERWGRSTSALVRVAPERLTERPVLAGDYNRDCRITQFDARQLAGVWQTGNAERDITDDGMVDLADVAAVMSRNGASCLADIAMPTAGEGEATLMVHIPEGELTVGETVEVDITVAQLANLGGFGLTLSYDPTQLEAANVVWHRTIGNALPLGPTINQTEGTISFGLFEFANQTVQGFPADETLVTVKFVSNYIGESTIDVIKTEAIDSQGRMINASSQVNQTISTAGDRTFLPLIFR